MAERRVYIRIIPTGNEEFDIKLAGGIPFPSLIFIEGPHGTGKTALSQLFIRGGLYLGMKAVALVSEATIEGYLDKSKTAGLDLTDYFIRGLLDVYSLQTSGSSWSKERLRKLLPITESFILGSADKYDIFLVDSLSHLAVNSSASMILAFFSTLRRVTDMGKLVIVTMHEGVLPEDLVTRARAICDGYMKLGTAVLAGRSVNVLRIVKLKGAPTTFESTISFNIDPAFGIKLVPIALASV
ncbi:MAG: ATPase [Desulfurococcales archaeon]|nr:ATPase [Desulfurococcales archaeon]